MVSFHLEVHSVILIRKVSHQAIEIALLLHHFGVTMIFAKTEQSSMSLILQMYLVLTILKEEGLWMKSMGMFSHGRMK